MKNCSIFLPFNKRGTKLILSLILIVFLVPPFIKAQENISDNKSDTLDYSWERFSFSLGGFITGLNSDILIGSQQVGLGVSINLEDALGLVSSTLVLRGDLEYHFGKRDRH